MVRYLVGRGENVLVISYKGGRELVRSSRFGAIRVLHISNSIIAGSLDNSLMKVCCIAISMCCPILFGPLHVKLFVPGLDLVVHVS